VIFNASIKIPPLFYYIVFKPRDCARAPLRVDSRGAIERSIRDSADEASVKWKTHDQLNSEIFGSAENLAVPRIASIPCRVWPGDFDLNSLNYERSPVSLQRG